MAVTLTFEIVLNSDYHSGAGYGLGALADSALLRDGDGIPVLRGTHLEGLLRDGLSRLLQLAPLARHAPPHGHVQGVGGSNAPRFCGQKNPMEADCPLCRLFGSPRTPKRWRFSSARPQALTHPVTNEWAQAHTGGWVVRRARINPRTRRAEEHKLFAHEVGDSRLRFVFTAVCEALTDVEADIELLVAAARMVRHLGASRRRGQGACRIRLARVEVDGQPLALTQDAWLERFAQRYIQPQSPAPVIRVQPASAPLSSASADQPVRFWLLVRTEEPVLVAERAETANQFDARSLIPGPAVRGALAGRIAARYPQVKRSQGSEYETFVTLFFRQAVRFPFLYPCQYAEHVVYPAIPAPRDLLSCEVYHGFEEGQHGAQGYATTAQIPSCPRCQEGYKVETPLKPLGDVFIPLRGAPRAHEPKRQTEMHITLNPDTGRVRTGALYGYVALEVGQYFVGELWCANQQTWEALRTLAHLPEPGRPFTLHVGKAVGRGYGRTTAWLMQQDSLLWLPQPLAQRVHTADAPFTLTLLTDTIVQDTWGRFYTSFHEDWLREALGLEVEIMNQFSAAGSVDSFNAHLGLPRHRDLAIRAGSAVGLRLKGPLSPDWQTKLAQCERDGIGLRRDEGFGRVAFNHPVYRGNHNAVQCVPLAPEQRLSSPSDHLLSRRAAFERRWRLEIENADWTTWADNQGQFVAVGRLLHASQGFPLETIERMLNFLGNERSLLGQELVGRQKEHFFRSPEAGQRGVDTVHQLVRQLRELLTNEEYNGLSDEQRAHLQQLGLAMLAAKVVGVASQAREAARGAR